MDSDANSKVPMLHQGSKGKGGKAGKAGNGVQTTVRLTEPELSCCKKVSNLKFVILFNLFRRIYFLILFYRSPIMTS